MSLEGSLRSELMRNAIFSLFSIVVGTEHLIIVVRSGGDVGLGRRSVDRHGVVGTHGRNMNRHSMMDRDMGCSEMLLVRIMNLSSIWISDVMNRFGMVGIAKTRVVAVAVFFVNRILERVHHVTHVLAVSDIMVIVTLLSLLASGWLMLISRLAGDRLHSDRMVELTMMEQLSLIRLHFEHEVAILDISLRRTESCRICIKCGVITLVPPFGVERIKIVAPVELEGFIVRVPGIGLNIVVLYEPWHVLSGEPFTPRFESGSPEVHHDGLTLLHEGDRGIVTLNTSHLLVVDGPGDELRCPGHLVDMPVVFRVETAHIVMALLFMMTVAIDDIERDRILFDRGDDLHIELVPATRVEIRSIPVSKEGRNCALLVRSLHTGDEFTVSELFEASNGA